MTTWTDTSPTRSTCRKVRFRTTERPLLDMRRAELPKLKFVLTSSFYPPYHVGGDANHVRYLAEELDRLGNEVHVIHSLDAYRLKRRERDVPQRCGSHVILHTIKTRFSRSAYEAYALGASHRVTDCFRATVREVKPDIVHHHNISLLGFKILERHGNYLNLYTAHDYWLICPGSNLLRNGRVCVKASCIFCGYSLRRPPQLWRYGSRFRSAIGQIDTLIAPSNYLKDRITREIPVRAVTIPNFVPKPPDQISPSGFSRFLLYAGMLERHKGVLELLRAFKELARQANLKLVIAGDGSLREEVRMAITQANLSDMVHLTGWLDHDRLYPLLRDSASLVVPSIAPENAPLVALEALSVGTPVVASNLGGLPEIVSHLDTQLVFSWEHEGDFGRAISYCLSENSRLRHKSRQIYLEHFTTESYVTSYLALLRKMRE
jgi:glycosyltransferase involved in cell wall biosynthesis